MANDTTQTPRQGFHPLQTIVDDIASIGGVVLAGIELLGDLTLFTLQTISWLLTRLPRRDTIIPNFYQIGVLSLPVVALTGTFIGMVLAVQSYAQFRGLGSRDSAGRRNQHDTCKRVRSRACGNDACRSGRQRDGSRAWHHASYRTD